MNDDLLIEKEKLFTLADNRTRGHGHGLKVQEKERCCRQAFFTKRVVTQNSLPDEVVNSGTQ